MVLAMSSLHWSLAPFAQVGHQLCDSKLWTNCPQWESMCAWQVAMCGDQGPFLCATWGMVGGLLPEIECKATCKSTMCHVLVENDLSFRLNLSKI